MNVQVCAHCAECVEEAAWDASLHSKESCSPSAPGTLTIAHLTARRDVMGPLVNRRLTTIVAGFVAFLISALNVFLLVQTFAG